MKKVIALLLALAMIFALAACGTKNPSANENPGTSATPSGTTAVEPSDEPLTAGFIILGLGSEFFQSMCDTFVEVFTSHGWEATYVNGEFSPEVQIKAIENYTAAGVDLLVIFPSEGGPVDDALARAREAGIKVIEMVNCGENWDGAMLSDNAMVAEQMNMAAAAWANDHFADAADGSVDVVVVTYYANDTNRQQAEVALRIEEYSSKFNMLAEYELSEESTEAGITAAENILTMYPDVDVIISPQGTVMVGINNYLTSMTSPIHDYSDFGLFAVNANSAEAFAAIAASANNESPMRGTVVTSGVGRSIADMYALAEKVMAGEVGVISYAATEIINAETVQEFLDNGTITSYTVEDLIAEVGVNFYN